MASDSAIQRIERQHWVEPLADRLQSAVHESIIAAGPAGHKVANALHGVWLGHPLHPVLTDIPIGSWTAAVALDALEVASGHRSFGRGADAAIGVGVAGALGAALAGVADWAHTDGRARRIGLAHGLLNLGALALYTTSLVLRRRQARRAGRVVCVLGFLMANASAYLGGHLVYGEGVGVDHSPAKRAPQAFTRVLRDDELPDNELRRATADGTPVLLLRREGRLYAIGETCAHLGGPLSEGKLEGLSVICPWHGSRYALDDGRVLNGPSVYAQPCFEARVHDGYIEVRVVED